MKKFPQFDWCAITDWWMRGDSFWWGREPDATEAHYRSKYEAVMFSGAHDIGEIGVRAGYGARAILQAPGVTSYTGYDNGHDGAHYYDYAKRTLAGAGRKFYDVDTQLVDIASHDFVHVDGDHSFDGAHHDIWMCLRLGVRWILVDDYNDCASVRKAVNETLRDHYPYKIRDCWLIDEPLRGAVLIRT